MTNKEAIKAIKLARSQVEWDYPMDYAAAFDKAIEALEQEPTDKNFTKADIDAIVKAINAHWELIIDEIRAEIETKYGQCKLTEYIVQYDGICTSVNDIGDIADILQIIDRYKVETEAE